MENHFGRLEDCEASSLGFGLKPVVPLEHRVQLLRMLKDLDLLDEPILFRHDLSQRLDLTSRDTVAVDYQASKTMFFQRKDLLENRGENLIAYHSLADPELPQFERRRRSSELDLGEEAIDHGRGRGTRSALRSPSTRN